MEQDSLDTENWEREQRLDKVIEQEPRRRASSEDTSAYARQAMLRDSLYRAFDALFELGRPTFASFSTRDFPGCDEVARLWALQNGWVTDEHDIMTEFGSCHVMVVRKTRDVLSFPLITIQWPPVQL